jgi:hypothetical protein
METTRSRSAAHPVHTLHRVGIGVLGVFLLIFGITGLIRRPGFLSAQGQMVMGLASNGLLAAISVAVAVVLIVAAAWGGHAASTVGIAGGALFLISGVANIFVVGTSMNMLAFQLSNVIFSLVVGAAMLFTGAYGRIASELPPDSPYFRADRDAQSPASAPDRRSPAERMTDQLLDRELAEAERAVAMHSATTRQAEGVRRATAFRTADDRREAYRSV